MTALSFLVAPITNAIISILLLVAMTVGFTLTTEKHLNRKSVNVFIIAMIGFGLYCYTRWQIATMPEIAGIAMNTVSVSSTFSLCYGLSQIVAGYLCDTYERASVIFAYISAAVLFAITTQVVSVPKLQIIFGLLGIVCSIINMCTGSVLKRFPRDWFVSLSTFGCTAGALLSSNVLGCVASPLGWSSHYSLLTAIAVTLAAWYYWYTCNDVVYVNTTEQTETLDIEPTISNAKLFTYCLYSALVVIGLYTIQAKCITLFEGDAKLQNILWGLIYILSPVFDNFDSKKMMIGSVIIGIISTITAMCSSSVLLLKAALIGITITGVSHCLPANQVGKTVKKNVGFILGLLNFSAMAIGCSGSQWVFGTIFAGASKLYTLGAMLAALIVTLLSVVTLL